MKSVVLLGSSDQLVNKPQGHIIDNFDIIWRTNHTGHPIAIQTYPELLGSKYGNWYCHDIPYSIFDINDGIFHSKTNLSIINSYELILHNLLDVELEQLKRVGCFLQRKDFKGIYKRCNKQEIFKLQETRIINSSLLFNSPFTNLYFGYLNWIKDCYANLNKHNLNLKMPPIQKPSSGLRMLSYLLNQYEHIHLIGFNGGKTGHWYTNKKINLNYDTKSDVITTQHNRFGKHGNSIAKHHLDIEYQFIKLMQKEGRITIL